eukprot:TRINITY_DN2297_c1_g1_i10.p1 TRINITY_DN2297_c1_g1~~TRINITY_DN2297_c1_g1_i10.p1  ORF type:complete len:218 (+),score=12.46 TRINITY_DN2297_c1_g1_i10:921-1574(+)
MQAKQQLDRKDGEQQSRCSCSHEEENNDAVRIWHRERMCHAAPSTQHGRGRRCPPVHQLNQVSRRLHRAHSGGDSGMPIRSSTSILFFLPFSRDASASQPGENVGAEKNLLRLPDRLRSCPSGVEVLVFSTNRCFSSSVFFLETPFFRPVHQIPALVLRGFESHFPISLVSFFLGCYVSELFPGPPHGRGCPVLSWFAHSSFSSCWFDINSSCNKLT